jgi:hypothetical protein
MALLPRVKELGVIGLVSHSCMQGRIYERAWLRLVYHKKYSIEFFQDKFNGKVSVKYYVDQINSQSCL